MCYVQAVIDDKTSAISLKLLKLVHVNLIIKKTLPKVKSLFTREDLSCLRRCLGARFRRFCRQRFREVLGRFLTCRSK